MNTNQSAEPTIMRNVVVEPGNSTAGVGIAHVEPVPAHETEYRIEQLWPDGHAEPVYVGDKGDVLALIAELADVVHREEVPADE